MESKEFMAAMKEYYDKKDMSYDKLVDDLTNGKIMSKVSKLHKKLEDQLKAKELKET